MLRAVRVASFVLLAVFVSRGVASGPQHVSGGSNEAGLRPGMLFQEQGITLRVPPPGVSVAAEGIGSKGNAVELAVETRKDGSVVVHRDGQMERAAMVGGTGGPCADGAYTLSGPRWTKNYVWQVSTANLPGNISSRGAVYAFKRAINHIINAYNDCGRRDGVGATATYAGKTSSAPDVSSTAWCTKPDGRNEQGFKRLPSSFLAYSCRWWSSGRYIEGDTAYNTYYKWYVSRPSNCYWRWSVATVATHELGHNFGLSHVAESSHPKLTMSPMLYPCQSSEGTLGLGDLRGLESLY